MPQALYRRYRPETFADVIGQEHVTGPLQQALRNDRVHHAYLFSGPRGCGKTTSARILARCLNCVRGPTPEPCGVCDSCVGLGRGGPGTIDVIEIDAASHGGVDDARDLREKAFFGPASSRYKIYIIDEAHMVSPAGFNALLKVVEEPPEHLKFIFATTEPERVIGTIRSRTHHYPFRLVAPGRLQDHLARICAGEGVEVEKGVLPLVVRAGRGSVRDALSVLDQLVAGAGEGGVTYPLATALLGFTDVTLLDDTIEAFAAVDGAEVFRVVDRVVEAGHDPRRFAEDLLERLRDLVVLSVAPDAAGELLGDLPPDQLERMRQQAARFGRAELSRAADLVNAGLAEMRGTTAPRLQLELVCARVLLPAAADDERSLQARLDRLERRVSLGGMPAPSDAAAPVAHPGSGPPPAPADLPALRDDAAHPGGASVTASSAGADRSAPTGPDAAADAGTGAAAEVAVAPAGGLDLAAVRRMWPDVLTALFGLKRTTWTFISGEATVIGVEDGRLTLGFTTPGLRQTFTSREDHQEYVRQALIDVLGVDWQVEAVVDPSRTSAVGPSGAPSGGAGNGAPPRAEDRPGDGVPPAAAGRPSRGATRQRSPRRAPAPAGGPPTPAGGAPAAASTGAGGSAASDGSRRLRTSDAPVHVPPEDDVPSADDADLDDGGAQGAALVERLLGGRVIGEYDSA